MNDFGQGIVRLVLDYRHDRKNGTADFKKLVADLSTYTGLETQDATKLAQKTQNSDRNLSYLALLNREPTVDELSRIINAKDFYNEMRELGLYTCSGE
jgi:hypothetical protein